MEQRRALERTSGGATGPFSYPHAPVRLQSLSLIGCSPEKAGVGGSTPSLATIFFNNLRRVASPHLHSPHIPRQREEQKPDHLRVSAPARSLRERRTNN